MDNEQFALEEYKIAKDKIRKNEDRRYSLKALNISAFAAIFGLSDKLDPLVIPVAIISVLLICSISYTMQSLTQRKTRAYVIVKFESKIHSINYESLLMKLRKDINTNMDTNGKFKFKTQISSILKEPFVLLSILGVIGSSILSYDALVNLFKDSIIFGALYILLISVGYTILFRNIHMKRKLPTKHFINMWDEALENKGPVTK